MQPQTTPASYSFAQLPKLEISDKIRPASAYDPKAVHKFHYEAKGHNELPHVVKFSGGRSSGMMLFTLLEAGLLQASRGDVVVFNNTSAEHPATYDFARKCKELVESKYGIPFFWVESQTYEDARSGEYARILSYRLVQPEPKSESVPDGYHWRGEVFEELLSTKGYVPNQFQRICTASMKLEATRMFLTDWFACKPGIERQGHYGETSRIDEDDFYARHRKNGGGVPREIFFAKKAFVFSRPLSRPAQLFADYSAVASPIDNKHLEGHSYGDMARFGDDGIEYLALVGLRHDEARRVRKVRTRNSGAEDVGGYEGEYVYMPLYNMEIGKEEVEAFWQAQDWDLELNAEDNLSNCTYCFLKGASNLTKVHRAFKASLNNELKGTPCDLQWWIDLEKKYGRDLVKEKREIKGKVANNFIGFFGTETGFSYERIEALDVGAADYADSVLPCDCTD